jgi:hypothetical protein
MTVALGNPFAGAATHGRTSSRAAAWGDDFHNDLNSAREAHDHG